MNVLDLAMFNPNGIVEIDLRASTPEALHTGLSKHFTELLTMHSNLQNKLYDCGEAMKHVKGLWLNQLINGMLPKLSLNNKLGQAEIVKNKFTYGIKRVTSLRDPYAKNLLDKYTQFLSRTGNSHDFADY
ncbi:hypothetical protein GCM10028803_50380 [Larkinella knui]|uniref:Uncharacterized protein n=1 Tax=Larkinella knui TaxID=2025310 RepID=A0A3P1CQW8_9BACT|nr:hypothetical protein [Larkinella knui]RRB15600.1 hypothetical protein EHT87_13875 [Larkinella knui]